MSVKIPNYSVKISKSDNPFPGYSTEYSTLSSPHNETAEYSEFPDIRDMILITNDT